jgi:hypothetical protein
LLTMPHASLPVRPYMSMAAITSSTNSKIELERRT